MRTRIIQISLTLTLATAAQAQWDIQDSHTTASLRGIDSIGKLRPINLNNQSSTK